MAPLTAGKIPFHTAEQILTAPLTLRADISIGSFTFLLHSPALLKE
jgi:hypothetical protein